VRSAFQLTRASGDKEEAMFFILCGLILVFSLFGTGLIGYLLGGHSKKRV
jgi:hypothetical protein